MATILLNDGNRIPQLGLGVYQAREGGETYQSVKLALENGYRHVDTAEIYGNEEDVGRAIKDSGVPREQIFVTTKFFASAGHGFGKVQEALHKSLGKLGLSYVDLYLVHSPGKNDPQGRADTWRGMEKLKEDGLARSIGVSNYGVPHLHALFKTAKVVPAVNQVELSPYRNVPDIVQLCKEKGIVMEAYSPLTKGRKLGDPRLIALAAKYNKSPAQLLIRYCIENGWVVLAKSVHKQRILENQNVFDFNLTAEDLAAMRAWEENLVTGWDPTVQA